MSEFRYSGQRALDDGSSIVTNFRLAPKESADIKRLAKLERMTLSEYLRILVRERLHAERARLDRPT